MLSDGTDRISAVARRASRVVRDFPRATAVVCSLVAVGVVLSVVQRVDHRPAVLVETLPSPLLPEVQEQVAAEAPARSPVASLTEGVLLDIPAMFAPEISLSSLSDAEIAHLANGRWRTVTVQRGDTLGGIFHELELGHHLLNQIVTLDEHTRGLARIRPGDTFEFEVCPDEGFQAMRAALDDENWLWVESTEQGLATRLEGRDVERRLIETTAQIRSSLYGAAKQAGLNDQTILQLANIFAWDIDFALDIRAGDRFTVIHEAIYREGRFLRAGDIVAARFTNQGRTYEAIRFGDGNDYYSADGRPMRQAFLRAPLDFTRVSSDFNPRRLHPVTRRVRPHNGTDYAAPTGTPVWAAGDGRVIESAYNHANGNYVYVQHGENIVTRYLHLSKRHVNRGERVRQGDVIGLVGATGLATGPHLHYEFLVGGTHRNPRTVDLPQGQPLEERQMAEFRHHAQPLLAHLNALDSDDEVMLAQTRETLSIVENDG